MVNIRACVEQWRDKLALFPLVLTVWFCADQIMEHFHFPKLASVIYVATDTLKVVSGRTRMMKLYPG